MTSQFIVKTINNFTNILAFCDFFLWQCFLAHRLEGGVISSPNAAPPPASARRNTDLTEELSQPAQTPDTQQSANSKATRNVTSSAESKDDSEGSSGGSAKNKLKGKKHSGRRGIQSWVSTSMVLPLPQLHKDSSDDDIATTPPLGAADRACAQLGANLYGTLDSVLVSTPHNSWTILSNPAVLKGRGYLGQYKTKRVNLPLPLTFRTPRYLLFNFFLLLNFDFSPAGSLWYIRGYCLILERILRRFFAANYRPARSFCGRRVSAVLNGRTSLYCIIVRAWAGWHFVGTRSFYVIAQATSGSKLAPLMKCAHPAKIINMLYIVCIISNLIYFNAFIVFQIFADLFQK